MWRFKTHESTYSTIHAMVENYYPPPEEQGGWRVADPRSLGVDAGKIDEVIKYHANSSFTLSHGGALLVVYKGHIICESYVTGTEGGPRPWTVQSCNDMKSSTKSVFGTAVGVFLDAYRDKVNLDSYLVGSSRDLHDIRPRIQGALAGTKPTPPPTRIHGSLPDV